MARSVKKELLAAPNLITMVRMAGIPVFLWYTYYESRMNSLIAALIFSAASATDFVDGYIARKKNLITVIGKFLDPLADKLIVMSAFVMLVHLGRLAAWVVILAMAREFIVTGLRTIAMSEGIVIPAGQEGKYKTAIQMVGIVFLLTHYQYPVDFFVFSIDVDFNRVGTLCVYASLFYSMFSMAKYIQEFVHAVYAKDTRAEEEERSGSMPRFPPAKSEPRPEPKQ
jgi:CDP-diacylglycerol--glycerol-3-phosphate 3-phosphatidyltransferase